MNDDSTGFAIIPRHLLGKLAGIEVATYVSLVSFADERGDCWPSLRSIASRAGLSVSTTQRALIGLEEKLVVTRTPRKAPDGGQTSNAYHVAIWKR